PPTFTDLHTVDDFARFAAHVREVSGGIPVGFKLSAQHIERDIEFAVRAGADYIILDGRGGGTGDAPLMFRDHISVPTIPALARARHCLDKLGMSGREPAPGWSADRKSTRLNSSHRLSSYAALC